MAGLGIGGSGLLGLAFEAVYGTWVPPTKFIPIRSESLTHSEDKQILTPIRGLATASKVKRGYTVEEGDIEFEVTSDVLIYFLYAARTAIAKTGAAAPFEYVFTPVAVVLPTTAVGAATRKTLSIYIERAGEVFAYSGCTVTSVAFTIDNGDLICTAHVVGRDIDVTKAPVAPTFAAWNPFGPGTISFELPTGTARVDVDTFTITIDDGGEALNRIRGGGARGPSYIRWGERVVSGTFDHDFLDLAEYNSFVNNSARGLTVVAEHAADDRVEVRLSSLHTNGYPINLGGLGDLVRATVDFRAVYGGTNEYTITVDTTESVV